MPLEGWVARREGCTDSTGDLANFNCGERDVPIQWEILIILAALFRLVAGITCCVAVFIVR